MKNASILLCCLLLIILLTRCGSSYRQQSAEAREEYPTFYIGQYSWDAMIFKDTVLYRQSFSDMGGMLSDISPIGNWRFINDSTLVCYNLKKKRVEAGKEIYYLDRIDTLTQLLVPQHSLVYYRDSLQVKFYAWIKNNPYRPEPESMLNKSDYAHFNAIMLRNHRKGLISKYAEKFDDLKIYYGNGF